MDLTLESDYAEERNWYRHLKMGHEDKVHSQQDIYQVTTLKPHALGNLHGWAQVSFSFNEGTYNIWIQTSEIWAEDIQNEDRKRFNFVVHIYKLSNGFPVFSTNEGGDFFNRFIKRKGLRQSWDLMEKKAQSKFCKKTMIRKLWYHNVDISELLSETSGFVMRCAIWRFNQEMLPTHTIRIREIEYGGK